MKGDRFFQLVKSDFIKSQIRSQDRGKKCQSPAMAKMNEKKKNRYYYPKKKGGCYHSIRNISNGSRGEGDFGPLKHRG